MLSDWDFSFGDLSGLAFLLHVDGALCGEELEVSLAGKVGTNTTVGPVGTTTPLGSSIDLHVINSQIFKVLGVGVGLEVVDQTKHNSNRLLGPSSEGLSELSSLASPTDTSVVSGVRNTSPVSEDIFQILPGLGDSESLYSLGSLIGILVMNSEISR